MCVWFVCRENCKNERKFDVSVLIFNPLTSFNTKHNLLIIKYLSK